MGWDENEMSLIVHQNGMTGNSFLGGKNGGRKGSLTFEHTLYPSSHSRTSDYSQDSYSAKDSDYDEADCPISSQRNLKSHSRSVDDLLLDTDSLFQSVHESLRVTQQELVQSQSSQDFVVVDYPPSPTHRSSSEKIRKQSKITEDIDEASRLCEEMLTGLQTGSPNPKHEIEEDDCFTPEMDEMNFRKYTGRTRRNTETPSPNLMANRLSVASNNLSFSEPDLVVLSLKSDQSDLLCPTKERADDENDELLSSLPATIVRKFVEPSTPQHSKANKQKGGKFRFKGKKNKNAVENMERKSEPTNMPDRRHTLNPSSSLYFNPLNDVKDVHLSPSKGITGLFKKKGGSKDGKKLKKTSSMHSDYPDGCTPDTPSKKRTMRSSSLAPSSERHVYINIDEFQGNVSLQFFVWLYIQFCFFYVTIVRICEAKKRRWFSKVAKTKDVQ